LAYSPLTKENIFDKWQESKRYTDRLTEPFPEYQRIARNEPPKGMDENYPDVTDGTTASIVQKTPKRVVQQLPTGVVKSDEADEALCVVAGFIYQNKILPYANEDYDLFEKSQLIIENGLTFGSGASYCPFINRGDAFVPDMTIPYWGDIYIQRGKKSGKSCDYLFLRSWWQKDDVESLIASEKKLAKAAKERGDKYEPTWDVKALEAVKNNASQKDDKAKTPTDEQRESSDSAIEIVTGFQVGVGSEFYTFNPGSKEIIRTKVNKDPRGKMPVDWFYGDIDGTNPFGRSIVEIIGPIQNLIDSDMQAYQYNRALALQPPVVKYGNIGNFTFSPNAVVDAKNDPDAKIVPLTVDTTAIANYPQLYGLQKSQLLNLVGSPDTSISSDVGNPGFSKTPAGINTQKASISVDDNTIRKQWEAWFENWSETAINIYFGERSGTEILNLDKETADKLRKLAEEGKFALEDEDGNPILNEQDQLIIDYDTATPALKFRVDASTSKMADDKAQLEGLQLLSDFLGSSQVLVQNVPPEKVMELWNRAVGVSGVEDVDSLKVDMEEFKQLQAQRQEMEAQAAQQQQMAPEQQPQEPMPEEVPLDQPIDQPMEAPMQEQPQEQELSDEDMMVIEQLKQLGLTDEVIAYALQLFDQGATPEDVYAELTQGGM
jgi:hypothetical protein